MYLRPSLARFHLDAGLFHGVPSNTLMRVIGREKTGMTSIDGIDDSPRVELRGTLGTLPFSCGGSRSLIDYPFSIITMSATSGRIRCFCPVTGERVPKAKKQAYIHLRFQKMLTAELL